VQQVGGAEAEANPGGEGSVMLRGGVGDAPCERARTAPAQRLDEKARLDSHRARRRAQAAAAQVSMPA
jgi:hypothetical protein